MSPALFHLVTALLECPLTESNLTSRFLARTSISGQSGHILQRVLFVPQNLPEESSDRPRTELLPTGEKVHRSLQARDISTHFWAWPVTSGLQAAIFLDGLLSFARYFLSVPPVVMNLLNCSVLDRAACSFTVASLCVYPKHIWSQTNFKVMFFSMDLSTLFCYSVFLGSFLKSSS